MSNVSYGDKVSYLLEWWKSKGRGRDFIYNTFPFKLEMSEPGLMTFTGDNSVTMESLVIGFEYDLIAEGWIDSYLFRLRDNHFETNNKVPFELYLLHFPNRDRIPFIYEVVKEHLDKQSS